MNIPTNARGGGPRRSFCAVVQLSHRLRLYADRSALLARRNWADNASLFVAASILIVFGAFGVHVLGGGTYEMRTIGAMTLRSLFWIVVTVAAFRSLKKPPSPEV